MKKKQGVLVLILTVVLIGLLAFTTAVGFGPTGTGSAKYQDRSGSVRWCKYHIPGKRRRSVSGRYG